MVRSGNIVRGIKTRTYSFLSLTEQYWDQILSQAAKRVDERLKKIDRTQKLILRGQGTEAETKERRQQFVDRQIEIIKTEPEDILLQPNSPPNISEIGLEALIGKSDEKLPIEFLEVGSLAARSVGKMEGIGILGTCFHIGYGIILTNNHVYSEKGQDQEIASTTEIQFFDEENRFGPSQPSLIYYPNPERFFFTNKQLDFTFMAVTYDLQENPPLEDLGWHVLIKKQGKIRVGDPVNIIQHPQGRRKAIVVHNSHFLHLENNTQDDDFCWYSGDTDSGSSGAPVFNNRWEVVALHHKAVPKTNKNGDIIDRNGRIMSEQRFTESPEDIAWVANEGIRTSKIVQALRDKSFENSAHQEIRDKLLELWSKPGAHRKGLKAAETKLD